MKRGLKESVQTAVILLFLQVPIRVYSQDLHLSIPELFDLTIQHSTRLKMDEWQIATSQDKIALAKTGRLPELSTDLSYAYLSDIALWDKHFDNRQDAAMPHNGMKFGLAASQLIFAGGKVTKNIQQQQLVNQVAVLNFQKDAADIKLLLVGKYLDLYKLAKQREVFRQNIQLGALRLKNIENLHAEGMVTQNDITRSQLQLSRLRLNLEEIENAITVVNRDLCITLGLDVNTHIQTDELEDWKLESGISYEQRLLQAETQLAENKISATQLEMARNQLGLVKSQRFPVLNLFAGNNLQRPLATVVPAQDIFYNDYQVGLKLHYDIASLYHNKEKINLAKHEVAYSESAVQWEMQETEQRVHRAYIQFNEACSKIAIFRDQVVLAQENYLQVETKYFNQLALLVDMIDASNEKLNAELDLQNGLAERVFNFYKLEQTTGNL